MSSETDRIPVPTNGTGPHRTPAQDVSADPGLEAPALASLAFTPTQLAVGFGILASLLLLLAGRLRRRRPPRRFGRR